MDAYSTIHIFRVPMSKVGNVTQELAQAGIVHSVVPIYGITGESDTEHQLIIISVSESRSALVYIQEAING